MKLLHESDFNGMKIIVGELPNKRDKSKTLIYLEYGDDLTQSSMFKYDPDRLQWIYAQNMVKLVDHVDSPFRALVLGLGGGSLVKWLHQNTKCQIDVVDIIPQLQSIAETYFHMPVSNRINVITEDAFKFVRETDNTYDMIFVDVCDHKDIDDKFVSPEFYEGLKWILTPKGRVAINYFVTPQSHADYMSSIRIAFSNVIEQYKDFDFGQNHIVFCK